MKKSKQKLIIGLIIGGGVVLGGVAVVGGLIRPTINPSVPDVNSTTDSINDLSLSSTAYARVQFVGGLCPDGEICKSEPVYYYDVRIKKIVDELDFDNLPRKDASCPSHVDGADMMVSFPYKDESIVYNVSCEVDLPEELIELLKEE